MDYFLFTDVIHTVTTNVYHFLLSTCGRCGAEIYMAVKNHIEALV